MAVKVPHWLAVMFRNLIEGGQQYEHAKHIVYQRLRKEKGEEWIREHEKVIESDLIREYNWARRRKWE